MNLTEAERHQVKYFIQKFEAIPADQWCCHCYKDGFNRHCASGHLGLGDIHPSPKAWDEAKVLYDLFLKLGHTTVAINDGNVDAYEFHDGPKARILAALHDLLAW